MGKKKFDFNTVVDLYRDGKTDEGCELLYDNIWIFIDSCKTFKIKSEDRMDIASESVLEGHTSILKSLDKSYGQIYNYIRMRIIGRLKNNYSKENKVIGNYYGVGLEDLDLWIESDKGTGLTSSIALKFIIEGLLTLSDDEKNVVYLRVFNYPRSTLKYISNISGISAGVLSNKYISAIKKIRKHLHNKGINYEDVF